MRYIAVILMVLFWAAASVWGGAFDAADARVQDYIVQRLATELDTSKILLVQQRHDEWARDDYQGISTWQLRVLGFSVVRCVEPLKGGGSIKAGDAVYLYLPDTLKWATLTGSRGRPSGIPPYLPILIPDDGVRLMLLTALEEPSKERFARDDRDPSAKSFLKDSKVMFAGELRAKYGLAEALSGKMFVLPEGCVLSVDYPAPKLPETESIRLNKNLLQSQQAGLAKLKAASGMISLTRQEMAELIYLAYVIDGRQGMVEYQKRRERLPDFKELCYPFVLKTKFGKTLFSELSRVGKAKMNDAD